ncbi:hypothetical protein HFO27_36140 [Rhizobium leguminosarum]|uniref:hypothetical protein n=1 Tax=Rhizobium leguminosarum TaxID=384 RepID=UPI001C917F4C|nr:hypothetical protein [Rhizobium leguminosarum]MBY3179887.1 hypothetical protein [Rhizobium leguminosarum]
MNTSPKEIAAAAVRNSSSKSWPGWRSAIPVAAAVVLLSTPAASAPDGGLQFHSPDARAHTKESDDSLMDKLGKLRTIIACGFSYMPECRYPLKESTATTASPEYNPN